MENNIKYLEEQKKVFQVITREFFFHTLVIQKFLCCKTELKTSSLHRFQQGRSLADSNFLSSIGKIDAEKK